MQTIILASASKIKANALHRVLNQRDLSFKIVTFNCDQCRLPPQPKDEGTYYCANARIDYVRREFHESDFIVAIESGINPEKHEDFVVALIYYHGKLFYGRSFPILYSPHYTQLLEVYSDWGYVETIGELMQKEIPDVNPKNWMLDLYGIDRVDQITDALSTAFHELERYR